MENRFDNLLSLRCSHAREWWRSSTLFLFDFEIQNDVLATLEAGDRTGRGLGAFSFRMKFVIGVRVQAADTVVAGVIGVAAAVGIGSHVFQKNNAARKRVSALCLHP